MAKGQEVLGTLPRALPALQSTGATRPRGSQRVCVGWDVTVPGCGGRDWDVLAVLEASHPGPAASVGAGWCCPTLQGHPCLGGSSQGLGMDRAVGSDVGQRLRGGQQVTLVWLWDQLGGHWYLGQCLSPSLAFLTGILHCRFGFHFFPLPFQPYFLNFILILPHLQPHSSCWRLSRGVLVQILFPLFFHISSPECWELQLFRTFYFIV